MFCSHMLGGQLALSAVSGIGGHCRGRYSLSTVVANTVLSTAVAIDKTSKYNHTTEEDQQILEHAPGASSEPSS